MSKWDEVGQSAWKAAEDWVKVGRSAISNASLKSALDFLIS